MSGQIIPRQNVAARQYGSHIMSGHIIQVMCWLYGMHDVIEVFMPLN